MRRATCDVRRCDGATCDATTTAALVATPSLPCAPGDPPPVTRPLGPIRTALRLTGGRTREAFALAQLRNSALEPFVGASVCARMRMTSSLAAANPRSPHNLHLIKKGSSDPSRGTKSKGSPPGAARKAWFGKGLSFECLCASPCQILFFSFFSLFFPFFPRLFFSFSSPSSFLFPSCRVRGLLARSCLRNAHSLFASACLTETTPFSFLFPPFF